jgi:tetratricopeptide (TPR) repeat protein
MRYALAVGTVLVLVLGACSANTGRVLESGDSDQSPRALATRADSLFGVEPRTPTRARQAFQAMREAARAADPQDPQRHRYLTDAAQYAVWAANHTDDADLQSDLAEQAITLCNTAIQADSGRVEGYYYRAAAIGLFIQENKLKGRSGMSDIRADAQRAIELDPTFSHGGPYRILGTLYLRAPEPPTGIGSVRRALQYLKQAHDVAPNHPSNILRLAEAHLEAGNSEEAASLLNTFDAALASYDGTDLAEEDWKADAAALRQRLDD